MKFGRAPAMISNLIFLFIIMKKNFFKSSIFTNKVFDLIFSKPMDKLILSTSVSSVFWEGVNDRYRNNLDLSISTIYKLYESIMISLGFYNTDLNNSTSAYYYESLDYNSSFIGLGINWQVKNFDIQCEFLDNKLFASKISKQTQVKIGIDFTYN